MAILTTKTSITTKIIVIATTVMMIFSCAFTTLAFTDAPTEFENGVVKQVATGYYHSLALMEDGTVWSWGYNGYGQLGNATSINQVNPVKVEYLSDVVLIAASQDSSFALKADGTVWSWGRGASGVLGNFVTTAIPVPIQAYGLKNIVDIKASGGNTLFLKSDGTVWVCGYYLGDGTNNNSIVAKQVPGLSNIVSIATISSGNFAVQSDGTVWLWGSGTTPQIYTNIDEVTTIYSYPSSSHFISKKFDNSIWGLGDNRFGQFGNGQTASNVATPQMCGNSLTDVVDVACGYCYTLFLQADGTVWSSGNNQFDQLGNGAATSSNVIVPAQVLGLTDIVSISAGYYFNLAVKSDGSVWSWGDNTHGQLGDGTKINRKIPVMIKGPGTPTDPGTDPTDPGTDPEDTVSALSVLLETGEYSWLLAADKLSENLDYDWDSSDPSVVTVDKSGRIQGVSKGDAVISATNPEQNITKIISIKVIDALVINDDVTGTGISQIEYSSNWGYQTRIGAYNDDESYTNVPDSYFQVKFDGTSIKWYGAFNDTCGIAQVYIDDVLVDTIDCYNPTRLEMHLIFDSDILEEGLHTLKVVLTNGKNPNSIERYITVDKIEIN